MIWNKYKKRGNNSTCKCRWEREVLLHSHGKIKYRQHCISSYMLYVISINIPVPFSIPALISVSFIAFLNCHVKLLVNQLRGTRQCTESGLTCFFLRRESGKVCGYRMWENQWEYLYVCVFYVWEREKKRRRSKFSGLFSHSSYLIELAWRKQRH